MNYFYFIVFQSLWPFWLFEVCGAFLKHCKFTYELNNLKLDFFYMVISALLTLGLDKYPADRCRPAENGHNRMIQLWPLILGKIS